MPTPKAILIFGKTGSGKSELSSTMHQEHGYKTLCPHGWIKRQLEIIYDLKKGALEHKEGKEYKPPGSFQTMEEILLGLFKFWEETDPWHTARGFKQVLAPVAESRQNITINGIRNPHDVAIINELLSDNNYHVVKIWIESPCAKDKSSDAAQGSNFRNSYAIEYPDYYNDMKPKSLVTLANKLINYEGNKHRRS